MHSNLKDETVIAQAELSSYLEAQVSATTPNLLVLVPTKIKVERVGFTRNASNTPYLVYKVGDRRCCTFIKRRVFFDLVRVLLSFKYGIEDRIACIRLSLDFGLSVDTTGKSQYIASTYINKFLERYNQVALEKTKAQQCECNDLFDMCLHSIANHLFHTPFGQQILNRVGSVLRCD